MLVEQLSIDCHDVAAIAERTRTPSPICLPYFLVKFTAAYCKNICRVSSIYSRKLASHLHVQQSSCHPCVLPQELIEQMLDNRDAIAACHQQHPERVSASMFSLQHLVERHRCERLWLDWRVKLNPLPASKSAADADITESWPSSTIAGSSVSGSQANDSSSAAVRQQQPAASMTTAERERAVAEMKGKLVRAKAKKQRQQVQKQRQATAHTELVAQSPTRRSAARLVPHLGAVAALGSRTHSAAAEHPVTTAIPPGAPCAICSADAAPRNATAHGVSRL